MVQGTIDSSTLYRIISSPEADNETKLKAIIELKTHVKKDFVDIKQVPEYLEALSKGVKISDSSILSNSFSVISHLVKRVSMQDSSGEALKSQSHSALPLIINKLGDAKHSCRNSAKKALEAYWLSAPSQVERALIEVAFVHRNLKVTEEAILWLDNLIHNINPRFKLNQILASLVSVLLLHYHRKEIVECVGDFFVKYFNLKHNRLYKYDLFKELEVQQVPKVISESILTRLNQTQNLSMSFSESKAKEPDPRKLDESANMSSSSKSIRRGETILIPGVSESSQLSNTKPQSRIATRKPSSVINEDKSSNSNSNSVSTGVRQQHRHNSSTSRTLDGNNQSNLVPELEPEIEKVISKFFSYKIDDSMPPINIKSADHLYDVFHGLITAFNGKESEFNWAAREKNIITMRSIVRGNSAKEYINDLVTCMKEVSDAICKAISSLRTTLCSHGCLLVKESAIILQEYIDPLAESFLPALIKLCSATKHLASVNANTAICTIFINVSYNFRWLQKASAAAWEKSILPRSYCGTWLQIFLLRFYDNPNFLGHHGSLTVTGLEQVTKTLVKLLGDPNPTVRQSAKDLYWGFWNKFPQEADALLSKLDQNTIKAIERSRGASLALKASAAEVKKPKVPIKETIKARNKEHRSRQKEDGDSWSPTVSAANSLASTPDPLLNTKHDTFHEMTEASKVNKIGSAKRNLSLSAIGKNGQRQADSLSRIKKVSDSGTPKTLESSKLGRDQDVPLIGKSRTAPPNSAGSKEPSVLSFDKQRDPILQFLSSNRKELKIEGINLLKYAILGDEDLSGDVNGLLEKISFSDVEILKPLLVTSDELFKKSYKFFKAEDFLRVAFLLIESIENKFVDTMINLFEVSELYDCVIKLISYTTSLSNLIDNSELTMQVIRFKSVLIRLIILFLEKALDKAPINDSLFLLLVANLFELVSLLKATALYNVFCELLAKLYSINPTLFTSELQGVSSFLREEIQYAAQIDGILDLNMGQNTLQLAPFYDLTRVLPGNNTSNLSPLKAPSDLTMLVPVKHESSLDFSLEPHLKKKEKSNEDHRTNAKSNNDTSFLQTSHTPEIDMQTDMKVGEFNDKPYEKLPELKENSVVPALDDNLNKSGIEGNEKEVGMSNVVVKNENFSPDSDIAFTHSQKNDINETSFVSSKNQENQEDSIRDSESSPKNDKAEQNSEDMQVDQGSGSENFDKENKLNERITDNKSANESRAPACEKKDFYEDNIFLDLKNSSHKDNIFSKKSRPNHSSELVENFAQVKITERSKLSSEYNTDNLTKIQSFIDKVDPLNRSPPRSRSINIYDDGSHNRSPQKVRPYSYKELNWFNFHVARLRLDKITSQGRYTVDDFESLCRNVSTKTDEESVFASILDYLQGAQRIDFENYFLSHGYSLLEQSVWEYFSSLSDLSDSSKVTGVMLLKQLLINRVNINVGNFMDVLINLSRDAGSNEQLKFAINETFDEASGIFSSATLLSHLIAFRRNHIDSMTGESLLFIFESVHKILSFESSHLAVHEDLIIQLNDILFDFLEHKDIQIRRCVILSYGRLLRITRIVKSVDMMTAEDNPSTIDDTMSKLKLSQRKLIDYYSQ